MAICLEIHLWGRNTSWKQDVDLCIHCNISAQIIYQFISNIWNIAIRFRQNNIGKVGEYKYSIVKSKNIYLPHGSTVLCQQGSAEHGYS